MNRAGRYLVANGEEGFALITVLWAGTLLSFVALGLVAAVRLEAGAASNAIDRVRAEAIAEAAINRAVLSLLDPRKEMRWPTNGQATEFSFEDVEVRVSIQDEQGKININLASDQLLAALFESSGMNEEQAQSFADRVADWRDPDNLRRLSGAEKRDYIRAGWLHIPRDRPFETIYEVARVMGMTMEVMQRIEPAITVHSNTASVDLKVAEPSVLNMISDDDQDQANKSARSRQTDSPSPLSMPIDQAAAGERAYTIRAMVGTSTDAERGWEAIVRLTGNSNAPIWMLSRRPIPTERALPKQ